ncbi:hypothetical protein LguiA_012582 [Lonicera macranthoides]
MYASTGIFSLMWEALWAYRKVPTSSSVHRPDLDFDLDESFSREEKNEDE